ncbi:ABC-three component system protein [Selenomonas sp. oral taxon 138]|uniref:ABC-three component system protein n=1 Tax=Selenomonas sp. oral taxon 138 TaxID=712532 RepID=UPI0002A1AC2C|nr:ABC-three component system protein [Selenomonas sp. oral taxon 138]EKY00771.1 hypothetical protein HMPREF9163_00383 [Selenomonas sp. oral taxon 138 str. F0429]
MLTISLFLQIMRKYVGAENKSIPSFCTYFFALFMKEPISSREVGLDDDDKYYPFGKESEKSAAYKMYKGKRDIPESALRAVHANLDKSRFLEAAADIPFDARKNLCTDLSQYGVDCTTDNVDETCAEIFCSIIKAELRKLPGVEIDLFEGRNEVGEVIPPVPIQPARYADGAVYLPGGDVIKLHPSIKPHGDINEATLPYIHALCEVYAEQLAKDVTPKTTGELPEKLQRHLELQRQAYFDAKSIERSVRDAFVDGERQFSALKDDAYDGIEMVYFDEDYETGYVRLREVLKKITSTELAKSNLVNIKGFITNKTRKGVCHILVDDARIKSWVNTDA